MNSKHSVEGRVDEKRLCESSAVYALNRIFSFIPYYNLEVGTMLPILQMRRLKLRKFKQPT